MGRNFADLINFINNLRFSTTDQGPCQVNIDEYAFYQFSLIPAVCLTLILAFTKHRTQKWLQFLNGRPGLVYPMDTLTRLSRLSYCAAFGATAFLVYEIALQAQFAIQYNGPIALKSLIAIVSMFIYGMVFFPIFASLTLRTALSYGLGSLYIWVFFIVDVYSLTQCSDDSKARKAQVILRYLPSVVCRAFLSISLPIKFVRALKKGNYFKNIKADSVLDKTIGEIRDSYQGRHVRAMLCKPQQEIPPVGLVNKLKAKLSLLWSLFYHRQKGFMFPSRFVSVMFVAACVVYILSVEFLFFALNLMNILDSSLESLSDFLGGFLEGDESDDDYISAVIDVLNGLNQGIDLIYYSLIVANAVACVLIIINILHTTTTFRRNLYCLYRGDNTFIPLASQLDTVDLCVGSIKFAGFQVAYFIWGFFIVYIILFLICFALGVFILVLVNGYVDWLLNKVLQIWPSLLVAIILLIVQKLLARYVFLQDDAKHLRLDNRRFYFIFAYFMFFYNIFLGIVSCLLRIIKAIAIGILFLSRLDNSTLPRRFEFFDPGFCTYQGYIHMEVAHTHPVVLVFIQLLYTESQKRKTLVSLQSGKCELMSPDQYNNIQTIKMSNEPKNRAAHFNWLVLYTLLHNPGVRMYRKGFQQSLKKAMREGLKVPISDKPITELDLVKLQEEKEKKEKSNNGIESMMVMTTFRSNYVDPYANQSHNMEGKL